MTDILLEAGSFSIPADAPWQVDFSGATDIILPFRGTVVVPHDPAVEPDFTMLGTHRWMFFSLMHPNSGDAGARVFPFLRDYENKPLSTDRPVLFLVSDDHSYIDDVDFSQLFQDVSEFYDPAFRQNITNSCIPRYLLIEFTAGLFSGSNTLPESALPTSRGKEFKLKTNTDAEPGLESIRDALGSVASLGGRIRAFDQSGRQTEAYSALLTLGVDKTITGAPASEGTNVKIQFVDLHGNVLSTGAFPLDHLQITPALAGGSDFETNQFYTMAFTGSERKLAVQLETAPAALPSGDFEHMYHHHFLCIWPGKGYALKEIKRSSSATEFDLIKDFDPAEATQPTFVRICVFHPWLEFQSRVGGDIEVDTFTDHGTGLQHKQLRFADNKFLFFSARNDVALFNSGQAFFKDYHKSVAELKANDQLYQANWSSNPLAYLNGSMSARGIEITDEDKDTLRQQLETIRSLSMVLAITGRDDEALMLPAAVNGGEVFTDDFLVEVGIVPEAGEAEKLTHKGFVRNQHMYCWKLSLHTEPPLTGTLHPHRLLAYWKDSMGNVTDTAVEELLLPPFPAVQVIGMAFPADIILLETDEADPPAMQIRRTQSLAVIRTLIGVDPTAEMQLLVLNPASGGSYFLPLDPPTSDPTRSDVVLTTATVYAEGSAERTAIEEMLTTFSAEDELFTALVSPPSGVDDLLTDLLLTRVLPQRFSDDAIRTANMPMLNDELGGLLRAAIEKGVAVKGLYWEQNLAELTGGPSVAKGLSNNESIINVINRTVDGKRGFAFRDRSTRDFGSWHQKATVIFKEDPPTEIVAPDPGKSLTGYLGGIDLALGRWDTQLHFSKEPDRQRGPWYDIQLRIKGEATYDVLQNFKHRWKAIEAFLSTARLDDCRPVNTSTELTASVTEPFRMPNPVMEKINLPGEPGDPSDPGGNAFVQINRTIPPFSCFSEPEVEAITEISVPETEGELGSLESYKKAIQRARRFIIINDQYFFSHEIALLLHDRLVAADGPDFLIIALPKDLAESEYVDPHLFQMRKLAIRTLYYGATDTSGGTGSRCGAITPNTASGADTDVSGKVAIMTPVNRDEKEIYVHSKHLIVDDVWMTIGSANLNNRSLTYDMEINAAIIGKKLFKGGTSLVRDHRIEICRQLLGLPEASSALLQDAYATFRLFKAIEGQEESYSFRLHPLRLMTKWLDKDYLKRVGDSAFDAEVDFVAGLDFSDPSFQFLTCNLLDPDGRSRSPSRLGFLASLAGAGKTSPSATANLSFNYAPACETDIRTRLGTGNELRIYISVSITRETDSGPVTSGPFELENYQLEIATETDSIVLQGNPSGEVSIPISTIDIFEGHVQVRDETADAGLCSADHLFDPSTASPPITHGSVRSQVMTLS